MKIKSLFLIFTLVIFSCKTSEKANENNISVNTTNNINARLIVCSGLSEKNIPLNNLKEINVKEGGKISLYVKWFNLTDKSYVTSMDFLDVDGNYLVQSSEYKFKPRKKSHNTWNSRTFRKILIPEGVVKIRINLDQNIILEREIYIKYITE
ncbi:hypothetical protein [Lutibacter citreus]|uniref:hypothetical protein n=1 Tax=Lutibacter citreus TaxID=2138210 RepID=UPI000DBE12A8|nr:hypothetical protein [Lutibacter citreus]